MIAHDRRRQQRHQRQQDDDLHRHAQARAALCRPRCPKSESGSAARRAARMPGRSPAASRLDLRRGQRSAPARSRRASTPAAAPSRPSAPGAACAADRAAAARGDSSLPAASTARGTSPRSRAAAATTGVAPSSAEHDCHAASTAVRIPSRSASFQTFVAEVGDPHAQRVLDHHDLTGAAQHAADVDIDVLAGGARGADHAAFFERQHLARRTMRRSSSTSISTGTRPAVQSLPEDSSAV